MRSSTGMYGLGTGVLIVGAVMGARYAGGIAPASASAAAPAAAPAASPAFANLPSPRRAPAAPAQPTAPEMARYFGPDGMSLLVAGPGGPEPAPLAPVLAADQHR